MLAVILVLASCVTLSCGPGTEQVGSRCVASEMDTAQDTGTPTQGDSPLAAPNVWPAEHTADWTIEGDEEHSGLGTRILACEGLIEPASKAIVASDAEAYHSYGTTFIFDTSPGHHGVGDALATVTGSNQDGGYYFPVACLQDLNADSGDELAFIGVPATGETSAVDIFLSPVESGSVQGGGDIAVNGSDDGNWWWSGAQSADLSGTGMADLVLWTSGADPDHEGQSAGVWYVFREPVAGVLDPRDAEATVRGGAGDAQLTDPIPLDVDGDGTFDLASAGADQGFGDGLGDAVILLGPITDDNVMRDAEIVITAGGSPLQDTFGVLAAAGPIDDAIGEDLVLLHVAGSGADAASLGELLFFTDLRPGSYGTSEATASLTGYVPSALDLADLDRDGLGDIVMNSGTKGPGCLRVLWSPLTVSPTVGHDICAESTAEQFLGEELQAGEDLDMDGYGDFVASSGAYGSTVRGWSGALLSEFLR